MGERLDYSVLLSFSTWEEAEVVACTLRADGIDAFVGNRFHASNDWPAVIAMGGLQVLVPSRLVADAKTAVRARLHSAREDAEHEDGSDEPSLRRDHYKGWLVIGWVGLGFLVFGANVVDRVTLSATDDYRQEQWAMSDMMREACAGRDIVRAADDPCAGLRGR